MLRSLLVLVPLCAGCLRAFSVEGGAADSAADRGPLDRALGADARDAAGRVDGGARDRGPRADVRPLDGPLRDGAGTGQVVLQGTSYTSGTASSLAWTHAVSNGSNLLLVFVAVPGAGKVVQVTHAAVQLTCLYSAAGATGPSVEAWALQNPPAGNGMGSVTLSAATTVAAVSTTWSGVSTGQLSTGGSVAVSSMGAAVSQSLVPGETLVAAVASTATGIISGSGQSVLWASKLTTGSASCDLAKTPPATAQLSWVAQSPANWALVTVRLRPK